MSLKSRLILHDRMASYRNIDCHRECINLLSKGDVKGVIRKVFDERDPFGKGTHLIQHPVMNYKVHFVIEDLEGFIIEPFLPEQGRMPKPNHIKLYGNSEHIKLV